MLGRRQSDLLMILVKRCHKCHFLLEKGIYIHVLNSPYFSLKRKSDAQNIYSTFFNLSNLSTKHVHTQSILIWRLKQLDQSLKLHFGQSVLFVQTSSSLFIFQFNSFNIQTFYYCSCDKKFSRFYVHFWSVCWNFWSVCWNFGEIQEQWVCHMSNLYPQKGRASAFVLLFLYNYFFTKINGLLFHFEYLMHKIRSRKKKLWSFTFLDRWKY